ncbi:unnamed protein product [Meloidogyne enterolobii]|uniref:Uncharacterized protein n=1 Tax=Meloidogyne enterolobii TaxID=390850 RepID=A0ACB0Y142_MELEN
MESLENLKSSFDQDVEKMRQLERGYYILYFKSFDILDRTRCITNRKQLESQMTENRMVKEELDRLEEGAEVFKLIGPVLVKQELGEAKENVQKRIDYIQKEM